MNYIFDLYGTLIDIWTDESRVELWDFVAEFLGENDGKAVREEYLSLCASAHRGGYHELNLLSVFEAMLISRDMDKSLASKLATAFRERSTVYMHTFHGVKRMLSELRRVGGVYLLSNAQSCFTIGELRSTGLYDLFDGIVISSDVGVKKPSPDIFKIAFSRFGITEENSIYVGNDLRDDVLGATGVGLPTLYIKTPQSGSYDNMVISGPTYTVKNHIEMKKILLSLATLDKRAEK